MSWQMQIVRAKPNPSGKDTNRHRPLAPQLLGEWVDIKNIGDAPVSASVLNLAHSEFGPGCAIKEKARLARITQMALHIELLRGYATIDGVF